MYSNQSTQQIVSDTLEFEDNTTHKVIHTEEKKPRMPRGSKTKTEKQPTVRKPRTTKNKKDDKVLNNESTNIIPEQTSDEKALNNLLKIKIVKPKREIKKINIMQTSDSNMLSDNQNNNTSAVSSNSEVQQPVTDSGAQQPVTDSGAQQPVTDSGAQQPVTDSGAQQPVTDSGAQQPVTDSGAQQPVTDSGAQQPVTDSGAQQPVTDSGAQQPVTDSGADDQIQYEDNVECKEKTDKQVNPENKKRRTKQKEPKEKVIEDDKLVLILKSNKKIKDSKFTTPDYIRLASNYIQSENQSAFAINPDETITITNMNIFVKLVSEINNSIGSCYPKYLECDKCKKEKLYNEFKELVTSSTGRQKTCNACKSNAVEISSEQLEKIVIC
jgi:hypothetical protein